MILIHGHDVMHDLDDEKKRYPHFKQLPLWTKHFVRDDIDDQGNHEGDMEQNTRCNNDTLANFVGCQRMACEMGIPGGQNWSWHKMP